MAKSKKKWMQKAIKRRGALHCHYGIPLGSKIPLKLLVRDQHASGRLGQQVRFALGRRGYYKKKAYKKRSLNYSRSRK